MMKNYYKIPNYCNSWGKIQGILPTLRRTIFTIRATRTISRDSYQNKANLNLIWPPLPRSVPSRWKTTSWDTLSLQNSLSARKNIVWSKLCMIQISHGNSHSNMILPLNYSNNRIFSNNRNRRWWTRHRANNHLPIIPIQINNKIKTKCSTWDNISWKNNTNLNIYNSTQSLKIR